MACNCKKKKSDVEIREPRKISEFEVRLEEFRED